MRLCVGFYTENKVKTGQEKVRNNRSREREIGRSKQVTKEKGTLINFDPDQIERRFSESLHYQLGRKYVTQKIQSILVLIKIVKYSYYVLRIV